MALVVQNFLIFAYDVRQPKALHFGSNSQSYIYLKFLRRKALLTTEKEENAIAAPASIGERPGPPKSSKSPAATGSNNIL